MNRQKFCKKFLVCALSLLLFFAVGVAPPAFAAGSQAVVDQSDWQNLTGEDRYIQYHDNYHLDIEETGLLDAIDAAINGLANIILALITSLGYAVCNCFYFVLDFDLAALFSPQLDSIQSALKSSVFDALFILALAASLFGLAKQLARRNVSGLFADLAKILAILVLSVLVTRYSAVTISGATSISKGVGMSALADLNGQSSLNVSNYSSQAAGLLWKSLVHQPWESLEFMGMGSYTEADVEAFLTTPKNDDDAREALVASYPGGFSKKLGGARVGLEVLYLVVFIIKSLIFLALAIIQLAFQALAIFVVLLAPVILLLSLVPAFGGVDLIGAWFKKLLETQIMVFLVMLLVGLLIQLETLMYGLSSSFGWLSVMIVETFIFGVLALNYKSVLGMFKKAGTMVQYPVMARRQLERTDLFSMTANAKNLATTTQRKFGQVTAPVSSIASFATAHISSAFADTSVPKRPATYTPSPPSAAPIPTDQAAAAPHNPGTPTSQHVRVRRPTTTPPTSNIPPSPPLPDTGPDGSPNPPPRPTTVPAPAQGTTPAPPPPPAASPKRPKAFNHGDVLMADDTAPAPLPSATEAQAPPPAAQRPRTPASATPPAKASSRQRPHPAHSSSPASVPPAQYIPPSPAPESPDGAPAPARPRTQEPSQIQS